MVRKAGGTRSKAVPSIYSSCVLIDGLACLNPTIRRGSKSFVFNLEFLDKIHVLRPTLGAKFFGRNYLNDFEQADMACFFCCSNRLGSKDVRGRVVGPVFFLESPN